MNISRPIAKYLVILALAVCSTPLFAGVFISINIAPPPLPVYTQPICPDDGYLWVPGYWAYGDYGYFWVPGTWVLPPRFGVLWTPGYWGWGDGVFFFHSGYWGPHVGFYGGVNYGYGYGGRGYGGGRWDGGHFSYNTVVNNVNVTNVHNTYVDRTTINNVTNNRNVSYNGGTGGVQAQPTDQERQFSHEQHVQPTSVQTAHVRAASRDRNQLATVNGGKPATPAASRPEAYKRLVQQHAQSQPLTHLDKVKSGQPVAATRDIQTEPKPIEKKEALTHSPSQTASNEPRLPERHEVQPKPHPTLSPAQHVHPPSQTPPRAEPSGKPQPNANKPQPH